MILAFKVLLVLLLLFIIFNLARALVQMVRSPDDDNARPMSHYLGRRVLLSAVVVVLLIIALLGGWLEPNPRPY
ncbi:MULTISPECIES: DUF2909 family protein [Vibrio]|uniref:DUF2909 domain-containing protein n=1 Tax=Vibrio proteolyticus NBRC 13287 TaxID=1219065 RepID=U3A4F1_VIBPR|nr:MULTISPECIES: DUF2909 family protein [Vibrio]NAW57257.1 DUF2909 family protein [Vibrio sp. V36_P2S2PM302]NAX21224.1 DUF2909 family protein [Vibrio sp. V39_P1S14PM300]NAX28347.1 DUF2909 family protein [Vibrio sp. V38_P2S17PM301]NAX30824.1 DUF2909 family protein [Vibrio sp. V37_P2S8PM304]GAD68217.1 hypothetical protein VPR01S_12_00250 [Vibrio proteolyticus NBRC 13287]